MFTGLVENTGIVKQRTVRSGLLYISIAAEHNSTVDWKLTPGESISVDGVCLTVTESKGNIFSVSVSEETQERTTLKLLRVGDRLNLERALRIGDKLGGHFVTGHIDTVGKITRFVTRGENRILEVTPNNNKNWGYVVEKGSIAIDGISLTIASLLPNAFTVAIIPWTYEHTTLRWKKVGSLVNIEFDILGKYVERMLKVKQGLDWSTLEQLEFT